VPVNFGLKYRPPKLGLQYQIANKETTVKDAIFPTFVHEISLHWVTADSDVDSVFNDIVDAN
jgi:predicted Zn-dependent protease with MMP-like domain